ncbi:RtcB family protein [Gynurincola endophyticus]|uniref:RtcB family protein n=1 Tax=Gynurincola endophyticus TaxID=2479004 RepID=UPI000F8D1AA1|nr:RtcB family protein [Gynurincola endophyticus]
MELINYSAEPLNKVYGWLPHDLNAEKVIFFPDACPGKSPLPTGTVVYTEQPDWRKFAISDCGCGMLLCEADLTKADFKKENWDDIYFDIKANKGKLGDLGSGNHFLDALESYTDDKIYFLIHTGSRNESKLVDDLINNPQKFDAKFEEVCEWAKDNRFEIFNILQKYFGRLRLILDKNHNHFELTEKGVIIRKGAVKVLPGEQTVVPSNMNGDVVLITATEEVRQTYNSLCHGTGRVMSRGEAKEYAMNFDYDDLRNKIYIPEMIANDNIKTDAPFCYRDLDSCLGLIDPLITINQRFSVFAYLGQM